MLSYEVVVNPVKIKKPFGTLKIIKPSKSLCCLLFSIVQTLDWVILELIFPCWIKTMHYSFLAKNFFYGPWVIIAVIRMNLSWLINWAVFYRFHKFDAFLIISLFAKMVSDEEFSSIINSIPIIIPFFPYLYKHFICMHLTANNWL